MVALDPGVRVFQTFYSPDKDFGSLTMRKTQKPDTSKKQKNDWSQEIRKLDATDAELDSKMLSYRQRRDLTKSKYRSIERVRNLINEVHKKVANYLCSNYDTILLPVFETQQMVRKQKNDGEKQRTISS